MQFRDVSAFEREEMNGTTLDGARSRHDGAVYLQVVTAPAHMWVPVLEVQPNPPLD